VATSAGDLSRAEQLLDEAGRVMSRFPDGMEAMRARLKAARTALRYRRSQQPEGEALTDRELDVLRLLQRSDEPERDRLTAVPVAQHRENARPSRLPQARRQFSIRNGAHRPPTGLDLTVRAPTS
jgi:hypothetical protein